MTTQLVLLDAEDGAPREFAYDHDRFRLDNRTRAIGLAGIARARAILAARAAQEQPAAA
jgi:hypothetical protein